MDTPGIRTGFDTYTSQSPIHVGAPWVSIGFDTYASQTPVGTPGVSAVFDTYTNGCAWASTFSYFWADCTCDAKRPH